MIAGARTREKALVGLMAFAGLRTAEAARLHRSDILLGPAPVVRIRRGKHGKYREVQLDSRLVRWLREYLESLPDLTPEAPLFPGQWNKPLTSRAVQHIMARLSSTQRVAPVTPRQLRLACIRRWWEAGMPLQDMRQRLGVDGHQFLEPLDPEVQQRRRRPKVAALAAQRRPGRPRVMANRDAELFRIVHQDGLSYPRAALQYSRSHPTDRPVSAEAVRKAVKRYRPQPL